MAQLLLSKSFTACYRGSISRPAKSLSQVFNSSKVCLRSGATRPVHRVHSTVARPSAFRWGLASSCLKGITGKGATVAFVSPLAYLRKRREPELTHEEEVLAQIPKEVFVKDVLVAKKKKRNIIIRLFYAIFRQVRLTLRFLRLSLTFGPLLALYPVTYFHAGLRRGWWRWLLWACEFSGPTFTKLGQWAGTRRDLFSEEFCDLFSKLHTKVKPHSWYITRKKLTKAFGKNWTKIFIAVDKKPIGSGCIAQVHKGYMRSDMIPNETVIEEATEDDDADNEIDFSEGLEIMGFGHVIDSADSLSTENLEYEQSWRWWRQKGVPPPTPADNTADTEAGSTNTSGESEETTKAQQKSNGSNDDEIQLIPVAIKVLHPGVFRACKRDISILRCFAKVAEFFVPSLRWLSLSECIDEFSILLTKQLDLRYECRTLEKFIDNFADNPNIRFPRPVRPYCKRDALVESFEEGEHISQFINGDNDEELGNGFKETLAAYGLDALLQMVFVDNLVHGDLHPGNILVQNRLSFIPDDENKLVLVDLCDTVVVNVCPADNPVRLVLLDVGMSASLSETDMQNFKDVFTAVVIGEGEKVAELMLKHSTYNECRDLEAFRRDLGSVVMEARKQTIKLGKIDVGSLLLRVFNVLNTHKVKMESNFASIILALFVLEGIGRSLDPEIDILERAKPILLS